MAASKKGTKVAKKDTKVLTNGALALVITFSVLIGLLSGYLLGYLTLT